MILNRKTLVKVNRELCAWRALNRYICQASELEGRAGRSLKHSQVARFGRQGATEWDVNRVSRLEFEREECWQGCLAGVNSEDIMEASITGDREKAGYLEC